MKAELERETLARKKAEAAFEREHHLLQTLIDNLPDRIYFKDAQSRFVRNNKVQPERFGLKSQQDFDFLSEMHARQAFEDEQQVMKTGESITICERETWPDGRITWTKSTKVCLRDKQGKVVGTFGTSIDITQTKRVEEELRRIKEELELRVQQRTMELQAANSALQVQIKKSKEAHEQLEVSLHEKETLLKEIHHRVKNNMQLVSSLLEMQARYIEEPKALSAFQECQNRVRCMALIHEKLYQSKSLAEIDFGDYIGSLARLFMRTYHTSAENVRLEISVQPTFLNLETAIPFGLLLNEIISNCLEHAFPDQRPGVIRVSLKPAAYGQFTLTVEDDGVGLPEKFDLQQNTSLGLRLICILTEQIHGSIQIRRQPGAAFTITAQEIKIKERIKA